MHHDQFYHAFLIVIGLFSQPTLPKNLIYDTSTAFYGFEFNPEAVPCGTLPLKITSRTELFSFFMTKTVIETCSGSRIFALDLIANATNKCNIAT